MKAADICPNQTDFWRKEVFSARTSGFRIREVINVEKE